VDENIISHALNNVYAQRTVILASDPSLASVLVPEAPRWSLDEISRSTGSFLELQIF
jgi:hypothetical protein